MNNRAHVFMNKFCVLSRDPNTYFMRRLSEEVGKEAFILFDPFEGHPLPEAPLYLVRTTGVYHSEVDLELLKQVMPNTIINPLPALKNFRSKLSQYQWFKDNNVSIPEHLNLMDTTKQEIQKFFEVHREVIIKPRFGQGGWGVRLLSEEEAIRVSQSEDNSYLLQPYLKGEEIRYFFIEGKPPLIQRRIPIKGIAANFQSEGRSEIISLASGPQKEIERIITLSGARYGAVDFFKRGDEILVLELNTVPGIEQAEKISKRNLMGEILSLFNK